MSDSDDDSIEIIERTTVDPSLSGNDKCQLCSTNLHGLGKAQRDDHYDRYHSDAYVGSRTSKCARPKLASVSTSRRKTTPMKSRGSAENAVQEDVFWYPAQAKPPPDNYTPGKAPLNALFYAMSGYPIFTVNLLTQPGAAGTYRNFLMTCAALMDQQFQTLYSAYLDDPLPPGVRNLQRWLEDAWRHGYDESGAHYFEHQLVDTKKKLGTGDLYVAFTSRKIPCVLVDFDLRNSSKGFDTLTEWIVNYFTEKPEGDVNKILRTASPVVATGKMPVILQYDGHSVTIVGYELAKNGKYSLLVFDPSSKVDKNIRQAALNGSSGVDLASSSISLGKGKRRDQSKSPSPKKRSRTNREPDDGVVSIADSDDEITNARRAVALKSTLDPAMVIKAFRLKAHKKKHDYQLLYFTLGNPLSDEEQNDRKVVLSLVGC